MSESRPRIAGGFIPPPCTTRISSRPSWRRSSRYSAAGVHEVQPSARSLLQLPVDCDQEADEGGVHVAAPREIREHGGHVGRFLDAREERLPQRVAQGGADAAERRDEDSAVVLADENAVRVNGPGNAAVLPTSISPYYNSASMAETTPMMAQYRRIKDDFADSILFFRLGDFYEMFDGDAREASSLLDLTLTQRAGVPMCGIPYHAATSYIQRLLAGREESGDLRAGDGSPVTASWSARWWR